MGLCDGDTEKSAHPPAGLDVCIYYTLEEIKRSQSELVSRSPVEYVPLGVSASHGAGVRPAGEWPKSCAPVFLWSKGIPPRLNPPDVFFSPSLNNSSFSLPFQHPLLLLFTPLPLIPFSLLSLYFLSFLPPNVSPLSPGNRLRAPAQV